MDPLTYRGTSTLAMDSFQLACHGIVLRNAPLRLQKLDLCYTVCLLDMVLRLVPFSLTSCLLITPNPNTVSMDLEPSSVLVGVVCLSEGSCCDRSGLHNAYGSVFSSKDSVSLREIFTISMCLDGHHCGSIWGFLAPLSL